MKIIKYGLQYDEHRFKTVEIPVLNDIIMLFISNIWQTQISQQMSIVNQNST